MPVQVAVHDKDAQGHFEAAAVLHEGTWAAPAGWAECKVMSGRPSQRCVKT